jgi:hypothetical protein
VKAMRGFGMKPEQVYRVARLSGWVDGCDQCPSRDQVCRGPPIIS